MTSTTQKNTTMTANDPEYDWGKIKLGNTSKKIDAEIRFADWKQIDNAPEFSNVGAASAALSVLPEKRRTNRAVLSWIMGIVKGGLEVCDRENLFDLLRKHYTKLNKRWVDAAYDLCVARVKRDGQIKMDKTGDYNKIGVHGRSDRIAYGRKKLKEANIGTPDESPTMYRYGSEIGFVSPVAETDSATVEIATREKFSVHVSDVAPFDLPQGDDRKPLEVEAPRDVVSALYTETTPPLPFLRGITRFPTFSERGQLHLKQGYNKETFDYLHLPKGLEIEHMGIEDAKKLLVEELLGDFMFDGVSRDEILGRFRGQIASPLPPSMLNALGVLVSQLVRNMTQSPHPAVLITKPAAGTGATFLAGIMQTILTGVPNIRPPFAANEDERRKVFFTAAKAGEPLIVFDNITGEIDSPTLAAAWTSQEWTDRILGRSDERTIPLRSTTMMTSNNARFSEELQRRLSLIRLDPKCADPKARTGWHISDLGGWVLANRAKLLGALIALVDNWIKNLCPGPKHCPAIASYIGYCYVVGGIIETADERWTTFEANRDEIGRIASADADNPLQDLLQVWMTDPGKMASATTKEVAAFAEGGEIELPVKLKDHSPFNYSLGSLGSYLAGNLDRRFAIDDGKEVELARVETPGNQASKWKLIVHDVTAAKSNDGQADRGPVVPRVSGVYRNYPLKKRATGLERERQQAKARQAENDNVTPLRTSKSPVNKNPFAA